MLVYRINLKNFGKLLTSKSVGTGPSSYKKRICRAAVSQRLRNTSLHIEIQHFLFQFSVTSCSPQVIQQLLTSSSSASDYYYPFLYLSFNNVFYKAVPTQDVTYPFPLTSVYSVQDVLLFDSMYYFFISHTIGPTDLPRPSPGPHFRTSG